jgi:hypothetical protein
MAVQSPSWVTACQRINLPFWRFDSQDPKGKRRNPSTPITVARSSSYDHEP